MRAFLTSVQFFFFSRISRFSFFIFLIGIMRFGDDVERNR